MNYIALTSFSGVISMAEGEVREILNDSLAKGLMKANLIKKHVPSDSTEIQKELDNANNKIAELEQEKVNLLEEIETLKANLATAKEEKVDDEQDPEGEGSTPPATPEGNNGNPDEIESTEKTTTKNNKK